MHVPAIAAALTLLALANPAQAQPSSNPCAPERMPPRYALQTPIVPLRFDITPPGAIELTCKKRHNPAYTLLGCTFLGAGQPDGVARIHISAALSLDQQACVLLYEEAHLPPNNWFDPVVEATASNL